MSTLDSKRSFLNRAWLACFLLGAIGAVISWVAFPHEREKATLLQYLVFIATFVVLLGGVSLFPNENKRLYLLLVVPILIFNLVLAPKLTFFAENHQYPRFYTMFFSVLYPMFLASICMAYRLGGGRPGTTMKIGVIGVLVLFSGVMDYMWFILNKVDYATGATSIPHVEVFVGHVPSEPGMWAFIGVHFALAVALALAPLDRLLGDRTAADPVS